MALVTVQRSPTPSATSSPCVSESGSGEDDRRSQPRSISESFLTVKGAALFLPRGNSSSSSSCSSRITGQRSKHAGDLQQHLQTMFTLLRPEDNIRLAVRLESTTPQFTRYMVVVSTIGRQDTEESVVLGMDFSPTDGSCTVGMVLPLWSDTMIHLDGDGGFSVSTDNKVHVFKPVSVQAMWSALQSLHKACEVARCHNYFPGSLFLTWVSYYQSRVSSDQTRINEWNAMQDVQSHRADSPVLFSDVPTEREITERLIKTRLREIMMQKDLENVTCKEIRTELERQMVCNLREFKEYIDKEMIVILGQMDKPTEIFEHVYLGSEWNASNLEELQNSGVQYILNVTREIDNFFPGLFEYHNIRVYDEEATDLLAYWNDTYKFISRAKKAGAKCLVHCKMGVSRSASTVIAYAMKEYGWGLEEALNYVKERRAVTKPNPSFMRQLEEYQGILLASKQRHNKLWRSHSDSDLTEHHEPLCKTPRPRTLGRSNPSNKSTSQPSQALQELLQSLTPASATAAVAPDQVDTTPGTLASNSVEGLEDSFLTRLPKPQAATVVPEPRTDTASVNVAEMILVGRGPHPPPSPHLLPPSPTVLSADAKLAVSECEDMSSLTPDTKPGPQTVSTPEPSFPTTGTPLEESQELSHQMTDSDRDISQLHTALDCTVLTSDEEEHSSPMAEEGRLSSSLPSTLGMDHIDFFSAREKFLGLSQEGHGHLLSEQPLHQMPRSKSPGQEAKLCPTDDPIKEEEKDKTMVRFDSSIPSHTPKKFESSSIQVHSHATNVESTNLSAPPPLMTIVQTSSSSTSDKEEEVKGATKEREEPKEQTDLEKPEPVEAPPTNDTLPISNCPRGSVRRATQQLEQKMKQDVPSSIPLSSATASPLRRSPVYPTSKEKTGESQFQTHPTTEQRTTPPYRRHSKDNTVEVTDIKTCVSVEEEKGSENEGGFREEDQGARGFSDEGMRQSSLHTETRQNHSNQDCNCSIKPNCSTAAVLELEGVTEQETGTDSDCPSGPRTVVDVKEMWETLRELRAFLCQVSSRSDVKLGRLWAEREQRKGRADQARAKEVEARIRQAGLTPPSLLKRSASLAKLGSLELSANDLNELELSPVSSSTRTIKPRPRSFIEDTSKKKRILPRRTPSLPSSISPFNSSAGSSFLLRRRFEALQTGGTGHCDSNVASMSLSASQPSNQWRRRGKVQDSGNAPVSAPTSVCVAPRQQYGRTHPLRRLKKRTVNSFYHTM
ncbi:protein phosphatase Slingshot homolog 2b [Chanos chanos]|uniref:protein-serine/threonine phosphatase n=1 Tax=Chanos chanos TaxID=29144 RepID=A0A6J2VXF8_CHACN|nr:protein phosphatase Slingshot homolog 1-like [Chanos chanos]